MTYRNALIFVLFCEWGGIVKQDAVSGNGFQILAYGAKLIFGYLIFYAVRIVFAVLAPVTALIVMKSKQAQRDFERRANSELDKDL